MNIPYKELLMNKKIQPYLFQARFGMEKEGQRVTKAGALAKSAHPKAFGSRSFHPYIQTDFAEMQLEAITPVFDNVKSMLDFMEALTDVIARTLGEKELQWVQSMPPILPHREEEIELAQLENPKDVRYREILAERYGKRKQMVSGIHFNFEFSVALIEQMWKFSGSDCDFSTFKTQTYMKLARQYLRYMWILTYILGAAPRANAGFLETEKTPKHAVRSIRNSIYGYRNEPHIFVSYENLEKYYANLKQYVDNGELSEMKEFYSSVRLRGGKRSEDLLDSGVDYVEFRNFDLNPFVRVGMTEETARFIHLFALFLLFKEEESDKDTEQKIGIAMNDQVCLESPLEKTIFYDEGKTFFAEFLMFAELVGASEEDERIISDFERLLDRPEETIAGRMESFYKIDPNFALQLSKMHHNEAFERPFQLKGFTQMELSTQNLLFDAIQKGLKIEILDENDQMIALKYRQHQEVIKNGNISTKDSMVAYFVMENKIVTKKLLETAGFRTPKGEVFTSITRAKEAFPRFENLGIVIKPKSTNYGLGISIFKAGSSFDQFEQALKFAFREDEEVLIEEFISGTEYRFFVVDGKTTAVLKRLPANVIGDGKHTIEELVAIKNIDRLRGEDHRYPLEKIQLNEPEILMLETQGYTTQTVLPNGVTANLRENSNVSTGGDSVDMTDETHESYKRIAEGAAYALNVHITGIDMMIEDITKPCNRVDAGYSIIEANFNPMMSMHLYSYQGKGRRVTMDVLRFLFPEVIK